MNFILVPIQGKIMLNDIEEILETNSGKHLMKSKMNLLKLQVAEFIEIIHEMFTDLNDFIFIDPQIPDFNKEYINTDRLNITH